MVLCPPRTKPVIIGTDDIVNTQLTPRLLGAHSQIQCDSGRL